MMSKRCVPCLVRVASALALALVIAGCTKGGQFDPTEMFSSDVFESKKKIPGDRAPMFPEGVPGVTSGVPAELMKGYQPPPEKAADAGPDPAAEEKPAKPKPKPRPGLAHAPAAPPAARAKISVGLAQKQAEQPAQQKPPNPAPGNNWPAPAPMVPGQPAQPAWPNPAAPAH